MTYTDTDSQIADLKKQIEIMQLQQQLQQLQGSQQGQTAGNGGSTPPGVSHKRGVRLEASTVKADIASMMSGTLRATLRDTDGEGLEDFEIVFLVTSSRMEVGRTRTDGNGVALLNAGPHPADPQLWAEALASGWTAVFPGTKDYYPAEAAASVHLSLA